MSSLSMDVLPAGHNLQPVDIQFFHIHFNSRCHNQWLLEYFNANCSRHSQSERHSYVICGKPVCQKVWLLVLWKLLHVCLPLCLFCSAVVYTWCIPIWFCSNECQYYYRYRELAKRNKRECMSVIIDGMDQAKTNLPHFLRERKCGHGLWKMR